MTVSGAAMIRVAALAAENVDIGRITLSEIRIPVPIYLTYMELAVQALHDTFEQEKAEGFRREPS